MEPEITMKGVEAPKGLMLEWTDGKNRMTDFIPERELRRVGEDGREKLIAEHKRLFLKQLKREMANAT